MKNSVLIIGLDGTSWTLLDPWIKNGKLPNLSKLIRKGSKGDLKTTIPILSCSAWTSLFTGKNPGKHGIFEYIDDSGALINSRLIKTEKIWKILSHYNKRCCVINVPNTYPVEKINGCMVSCVLTPADEKVYSYPPELMSLLKKYDYKIRIRYGRHTFLNSEYVIGRRYKFLKELYDMLDKRYYVSKELMNEKWDFFMHVFTQETGTLQHIFFDRKDVMLKLVKKIDFYVGDLIKTFSSKNPNPYIFIVSDHGFSASPTRSVNMKIWLEKNGFLKDNRTIAQKVIPKIYNKLNKRIPLYKLVIFFNKTKRIRETFQRELTRSSNIYYKYPGVCIRRNGLDENEYEKLRSKLIKELKQLEDPSTNEKVFQIVDKRESIYSGKYSKYAPDIVALAKHRYDVTFSYDSKVLFKDLKLNLKGKHFSDIYGIFLASGKEIQTSVIKDTSILDIFPTVLHILGVPLPKDLDGKVLKDIFKKNSDLYSKKLIYSEEATKMIQEKDVIRDVLQDIKI